MTIAHLWADRFEWGPSGVSALHAGASDLPVGQEMHRARKSVQPSQRKYSASRLPQITIRVSAVPARKGAYRDRHGRWAGDAMDALASGAILARTNDAVAYGEVAWSWRSDARAKFAKTLTRLADDGGNQAWSPGRSRISRKAIAQGRPDDPPVPVVLPRASCCTRAMGAVGTRPSLRPLMIFEGGLLPTARTFRAART
jgi:hypothetical protein